MYTLTVHECIHVYTYTWKHAHILVQHNLEFIQPARRDASGALVMHAKLWNDSASVSCSPSVSFTRVSTPMFATTHIHIYVHTHKYIHTHPCT